MADQKKKTKNDDKPYEEFRDDNLTESDEKSTERKSQKEKTNYQEWTLEELQHEAQRRGMEEGMQMDKEQLIKKLRGG